MSKIYLHYSDKTLVLDSSENLLYPLQGSLLRWDNLRVAFAVSLTQSTTDDNAGFTNVETLPIASTAPILNHLSFGIKNRGLQLPGEAGCSFAGYSNASDSNGSSLGFFGSTLFQSTKDVYSFNVNLVPTGISGYAVTSSPRTINLSVPFNSSGSFYTLPANSNVNFNGTVAQLASSLSDGATTVSLKASPPVTIFSNVNGSAVSNQVRPAVSLGCSIGSSYQYSTDTTISRCLQYPVGFVMQGSSNYATIVVMDYKVTNRGTVSQTMQVGYQFTPNVGDTSIAALQAAMVAYTPNFESSAFSFNTTMPTALFFRWPFVTTRLRLHSICAKKFG